MNGTLTLLFYLQMAQRDMKTLRLNKHNEESLLHKRSEAPNKALPTQMIGTFFFFTCMRVHLNSSEKIIKTHFSSEMAST